MAYLLATAQLVVWVVAAGAAWVPAFWLGCPAASARTPSSTVLDPLERSRHLGVAAAALALVLALADLLATATALAALNGAESSLARAMDLAWSTRFGQARLARAFCALGLAVALGKPHTPGGAAGDRGRFGRAARPWTTVLALLGFATFSFSGHAMDVGQWALAGAVDLLHLAAAAAWAGVLAHLAVSRWPPAPPHTVRCVGRFSGWAMGCLAVLGLTGAFSARAYLPGLAGLVAAPYGQLLALKMVLLAGALAAAAVSLLAHSLEAQDLERVARKVRRAVQVEAVLALSVVATAGLLRSTPPPVPPARVEARTFTWTVEGKQVQLALQPVIAGSQGPVEVRWELTGPAPEGNPRLTLDMPEHPMVPIRVALQPRLVGLPGDSGAASRGGGRIYEGRAVLPMAGTWQGRLEWGGPQARLSPFTFTFTVEPPLAPPGLFRLSLVDPWRSSRRAALLVAAFLLAGAAVAVGLRLFARPATRPVTPLMAVPLGVAAFAFGQAAFFAATPAAFKRNPLTPTPEVLARGAALVAQHCGPCAQWLAARPPGTDGDYFWWLREGYPGGSWAARKQALGRLLSDADIWAMVSYARRGCSVPSLGPPASSSAHGALGKPGCPAPDPTMALPVSDARRAGPYVVAVNLSPALPGSNELRVLVSDLVGRPAAGARVMVRAAEPAGPAGQVATNPVDGSGGGPWSELVEEEEGVYSGTLTIPDGRPEGPLGVELVVQGPSGEASAGFEWDLPVRTAWELLRQAVRAMEQLTALEEVQELDTGSARWRYRIRYRAPDTMWMTALDERGEAQLEVRINGSVQLERRPGEAWHERAWSGGSFRWPDYGYWQEFTNPLRLRTEPMGGRRMAVVGAYHPVSQTYWRLWVEERSGRVYRLEMVGPAHFMTSVFQGFEPAAPEASPSG